MFTGIVQYVFLITVKGNRVHLYAKKNLLDKLSIGDSVAINGVCLTVTNINITDLWCSFDLSEETISKTNFKSMEQSLANIELALKYGDHVGGHMMSGHVHGTAKFISLSDSGDMWIDLGRPDSGAFSQKVTYKGSIAVNGVSLTIAEIDGNKIRIALIPKTLGRTNLALLSSGEEVNVEFDSNSSDLSEERTDSYYMKLAIQEGEKGKVTAPPNPWVGCIIVNNTHIIGRGYHKRPGDPHAEVNAIQSSMECVKGATLYVTLEPCCHFGKTPPCTNLLIKSKIGKVIVGVQDPDERVSGDGIQKLKDAGIEVVLIENIDKKVYEETKYSLRQYLHHRKTGLPYVTIKIALSMDNCYRDEEGSSKWITHASSRREGHILRSQCQAIIAGASTAQQDDPELTVRYGIDIDKQPKRIVIDGESLTSTNNKIFSKNTTVMSSEEMSHKWGEGIEKVIVPVYNNKLDLHNVIKSIDTSVMHCLVEGGEKLQRSFLEEGLVNEIVIFKSPKVFGKNGYLWEGPSKNVKLTLTESKIIKDEKEGNNTFERYIVNTSKDEPGNNSDNLYAFDDINEAVEQFKNGAMVIVMDDENRENEGDLICAASKITNTQMTEMINHTTGIICVPMEKSRAKKLNLSPMCKVNTDDKQTAFTVSVDSVNAGTGVSSKDRLLTVKALSDESLSPNDLRRPGHIFPLIAHPDGLKGRQGHTEASVALCKLAGIYPRVAVIGELQSKDGTMKHRQECYRYAKSNSIPMITVQQLIKAVENLKEPPFLTECSLHTKIGENGWKLQCYGNKEKPHRVFIYPKSGLSKPENLPVPVRIHSECFTGDVFKSIQCDCGDQLKYSMKYIVDHGEGVIIFPSDHEGRGIGLVHKVKAYELQREGMNTFEANKALGLDIDARTFEDMKDILNTIGVTKVELLTDNPNKIKALGDMIVANKAVVTDKNVYNEEYLDVKSKYFRSLDVNSNLKLVKGDTPNINFDGSIDFKSLKIAFVYSMWHSHYINQIRDRLKKCLIKLGVEFVSEFEVPGSNEIPFKASKIAPDFDGIICIGILIKGDTLHFENVSTAVSNGIMQAQISKGIPMMNCVLSCLNMDQVVDRILGDKSTLDYIANALIKMIVT